MFNEDHRTFSERLSDDIAEFGGSWRFIIAGAAIIISWCLWNTLTPWDFDPHPFILLNLILSCVAAFQAPVILMSQNRAEKKTDAAYRDFFGEIKRLVQKDIMLERKILKLLGEKNTTLAHAAAEAPAVEELNKDEEKLEL